MPITISQQIQAGIGLFVSALLLAPTASRAHARLDSPPARDAGQIGSDSHKDPNGPCGKIAPTNRPAQYQAGSSIQVQWTETINHPGCFLIGLSTKMDPTAQTDFTQIANIKHTTQGAVPRPYMATVQLPAGVTCTQCTLQLRQIMLAAETDPCPPATIAANTTYYTCADVTLTTSPPPPDMAMAPVDMAQTVSPDLAVSVNPEPGAMSTGCQTSGVPMAGGSALVLLLSSAALLLHRRRT